MVNLIELAHVVDLLDRYASRGVVDRALNAAEIDRAMLGQARCFVPYSAEAMVVETVARAIGDRHLGARLGRDFDYSAYGAYADFVLGAPDLATALDRGRRALMCTHPGSDIGLRQTDRHIVVGRSSSGFSAIGHRHLDEGAIFVIANVARHFLGADWRPDWVELPGTVKEPNAELGRMMGAPVRMGSAMPGVAIRLSDLETRNPRPPAAERTLSLDELAALMGVAPSQSMQDAVLHTLRINHVTGITSEAVVARQLALGPRTLQRALEKEGTSFRELRARHIRTEACRLLAEGDMRIDDIGKRLGYTEPRSFRRAFKTWTGLSPRQYRTTARDA